MEVCARCRDGDQEETERRVWLIGATICLPMYLHYINGVFSPHRRPPWILLSCILSTIAFHSNSQASRGYLPPVTKYTSTNSRPTRSRRGGVVYQPLGASVNLQPLFNYPREHSPSRTPRPPPKKARASFHLSGAHNHAHARPTPVVP